MRNVIEIYTSDRLAARYTASAAGVHVGDRIVIREVPHRITTVEHEFRGQTHITRITVDEPAALVTRRATS